MSFDCRGNEFTTSWTDYIIAEINGITSKDVFYNLFSNQVGTIGDISIDKDNNQIILNYRSVNPVTENSWIRGELIFICN